MDDPHLDAALHEAALRDLSRLNTISRSADLIAKPILELARRSSRESGKQSGKVLKVLDVASGAGDLAIALQKMCTSAKASVAVHGLDLSPVAVASANAASKSAGFGDSCTFSCHDVLNSQLPEGYDVIVTSLFTHHLDAPDVIKLLAEMGARAKKLVMVNDLIRSETSLLVVKLATLLFTRSPIVHYDGPVSVEAAFTPEEMRDLAASAGLTGSVVDVHWPCRYLLRWSKNNDQ